MQPRDLKQSKPLTLVLPEVLICRVLDPTDLSTLESTYRLLLDFFRRKPIFLALGPKPSALNP